MSPEDSLSARATTDPTPLLRYRDGIYAVDLMTAAVAELDFFTWLASNPGTLEEICKGLGLAHRPVDVLLSLGMANGLVVKEASGNFTVTRLAEEHACVGSPWNLKPYYSGLSDRPIVADFCRVLRTGKPANWGGEEDGEDWHMGMEDEAFAESFTAAMNCRGLYLGTVLAEKVDLSEKSKLMDIGGGSGIYSCCFAEANPNLNAVVFEQSPVDTIASREIALRSLSERIDIVTGDMFESSEWPQGCDVHLFSNVLHDWDVPEIQRLLANSFMALETGGLILVHEVFLNRSKDGPLPAVEYSAILMHSTQGRCYGVGEMEEWITAAGFMHFSYQDTAADRGVITAQKP